MDQIDFIKRLISAGYSISAVSRMTGHSRTTIRKVLRDGFKQKNPTYLTRKSKGDAFQQEICDLLDISYSNYNPKDRLTAQRIFDLLTEKHKDSDKPVNISKRTVERIVKAYRNRRFVKTFARLNHLPGRAQVDFGEMRVFKKGRETSVSLLAMTFPYSNAKFAVLLPAQNSECLRYGLFQIFQHLGGVPPVIRFDNMRTAVKKIPNPKKLPADAVNVYDMEGSPRVLNENFDRFRMCCGFEAEFCAPASGHEKGSVENSIKWFRHNFFSENPEIGEDFVLFNQRFLNEVCKKQRESLHYKKKEQINSLFAEDKGCLKPLPQEPELGTWEKNVVDKYGAVVVDQIVYDLQDVLPHEKVHIYKLWDSVEVHISRNKKGVIIGKFKRFYKGDASFIDWKNELANLRIKGRLYKDSHVRKAFSAQVRNYVDQLSNEKRKVLFSTMYDCLTVKDFDGLNGTLRRIVESSAFNASVEDVICLLLRNRETSPDQRAVLEELPPELDVSLPPASNYLEELRHPMFVYRGEAHV